VTPWPLPQPVPWLRGWTHQHRLACRTVNLGGPRRSLSGAVSRNLVRV